MNYRAFIYLGMVIIALSIVVKTSMSDSLGSFGTVMLAVGGLSFIFGMARKKQFDQGE